MVKVGLYGPDGEFETMWTTPVGEHRYRLEDLNALGCTFEGYNPRYFVLDIAPEHDLAGVVDYLNGNALDWGYVDPSYEELFPDEP